MNTRTWWDRSVAGARVAARAAIDTAGMATLLAALSQLAVGAWTWPLPFVLHFFDVSAVVWIVGLVVAGARRARWPALLHGSLLVYWCATSGPHVLRALRAEPPITPGELRVVTINAGNGRAMPRQLVEGLRALDADLVLIQELADLNARAIERAADLPFPHRVFFPLGIPGKGVLARHALRDVRLETNSDGTTRIRGIVQAPCGDIEFVGVHASAWVAFLGPWIAVDEQIAALARELPREHPVIVAGDFNLTTRSALLDPLRAAGFREAFVASGAGLAPTFPVFSRYRGLPLPPIVRIDQVWARGLEWVDARAGDDVGSDHLPMRTRCVRRIP